MLLTSVEGFGIYDSDTPREEWVNEINVQCGLHKKWNPSSVNCASKYGCKKPKTSTLDFTSSFDEDPEKSTKFGTEYVYKCRYGNLSLLAIVLLYTLAD